MLQTISAALGFDPPDEQLAIPQFFLSKSGGERKQRGDRHHPPRLEADELAAIRSNLVERAARRKVTSAGLLFVVVDGVERAGLELNRTNQVQFEVEESAELIELRAQEQDGEIVLAAYLLSQYEIGTSEQSKKFSIVLEGGQKVRFAISLSRDSDGEVIRAGINVKYEETAPMRAVALF